MNATLIYLINWLQEFGYPALWLVVFVAAAGVPLPIALVLLAAGAFASLGDFNIFFLALTATSAAVCGDSVGYLIGRLWGTKVLDWLVQSRLRRFVSPQRVSRSRAYFERRGGLAIFLSRFLFSALGGVINLLAGADLYPFRNFLLCDVPGETLGAVIPLALGLFVGTSWEAMGNLLGGISALLLTLLVVGILAYSLFKVLPLPRPAIRRVEQDKRAVNVTSSVADSATTARGSGTLLP